MARCNLCDRTFSNKKALKQHIRDSQAPAHSYDCKLCNRSFANEERLKQHIRTSPAHASLHNTPLDKFFQSYSQFAYDLALPPPESYARLKAHYGWHRHDADSDDAWDDYQSALKEELTLWFGAEDDIVAWHALCRAIRIRPLPITPKDCLKVVRTRHVNIVDLIEWGREGGDISETNIQIFNSVTALSEYTKRTGKVFRNNLASSGNGNVVLEHLLRLRSFKSRVQLPHMPASEVNGSQFERAAICWPPPGDTGC
ncbi:hypothetical protein V502_03790 [Pseudogymnoascus sp. VKM F-4520 (FW-2644)]|nr:hypothetical protein V502_03790 [Pseudogymnoascus sp. VKM F-4520 (FW-2644)]